MVIPACRAFELEQLAKLKLCIDSRKSDNLGNINDLIDMSTVLADMANWYRQIRSLVYIVSESLPLLTNQRRRIKRKTRLVHYNVFWEENSKSRTWHLELINEIKRAAAAYVLTYEARNSIRLLFKNMADVNLTNSMGENRTQQNFEALMSVVSWQACLQETLQNICDKNAAELVERSEENYLAKRTRLMTTT